MATYSALHSWDVTAAEAVALQHELRKQVRIQPPEVPFETIAGADISFNKFEETVYAGIVVLRLPTLDVVEEVGVISRATFPYVPGLLTFREGPALLDAWAKLRTEPDVVLFDGQGIAHPRRLGIAAHLGLFLARPTFGCAKSVLTGTFAEPSPERGAWSPMTVRDTPVRSETIGAALRTKNKTAPVYISPGHLLDLETAIRLTLQTDGGYRIPEPTRRAHLLVNALRRGERLPT